MWQVTAHSNCKLIRNYMQMTVFLGETPGRGDLRTFLSTRTAVNAVRSVRKFWPRAIAYAFMQN